MASHLAISQSSIDFGVKTPFRSKRIYFLELSLKWSIINWTKLFLCLIVKKQLKKRMELASSLYCNLMWLGILSKKYTVIVAGALKAGKYMHCKVSVLYIRVRCTSNTSVAKPASPSLTFIYIVLEGSRTRIFVRDTKIQKLSNYRSRIQQ